MQKTTKNRILAVLAIIFGTITFGGANAFAGSVDFNVNIDPTLVVEVPTGNNIVLNLNPNSKTFDAKDMEVVVRTNNVTGYKLLMSTTDGNTYLSRNTSADITPINAHMETLAPNTSGYSDADFSNCPDTNANCMNKWGYKITASDTDPSLVSTNYFPFTLNTNLATNHSATNGDSTSMRFAAKINYSQMAGSYENTLVFTAVATYAAYHIDYYDGVDNATTIATQTNAYNTSSTVPINPAYSGGATGPTRSGLSADTYKFVAWCDQIPTGETADGYFKATTCPGASYTTGSDIIIDPTKYNTNLKLYAYWDPTTFEEAYAAAGKAQISGNYTMQDMSANICKSVTIGEKIQLLDNRSGSYKYYVAKLKDGGEYGDSNGKCWMIQNLRLGANTTSLTLTNANTNISASSYTLNNKVSNGIMPYTTIVDDVSGGDTYPYDGNAYYCAPVSGNNYVGCYYNWYTATAGTGTSSVTGKNVAGGRDVNSSICPKGWYLPKGGPEGDFLSLHSQYPSVSQMLVDNPTTTYDNASGAYLPGFLLGGIYYYASGGTYIGQRGYYWSRTAYSTGDSYDLIIISNSSSALTHDGKYYGFSVRCVAYGT